MGSKVIHVIYDLRVKLISYSFSAFMAEYPQVMSVYSPALTSYIM